MITKFLHKMAAIFLMVISSLLFVFLFTYDIKQFSLNSISMFGNESVIEKLRNITADLLFQFFGITSYLIPVFLLFYALKIYKNQPIKFLKYKLISFLFCLITIPLVIYLHYAPSLSGIIGIFLAQQVIILQQFSYILLTLSIIALFFSLSISVSTIYSFFINITYVIKHIKNKVFHIFKNKKELDIHKLEKKSRIKIIPNLKSITRDYFQSSNKLETSESKQQYYPSPLSEDMDKDYNSESSNTGGGTINNPLQQIYRNQEKVINVNYVEEISNSKPYVSNTNNNITEIEGYNIPLDFLKLKKQNDDSDPSEIRQNALHLEQIIKEFGLKCTVVNIQRGPIVTLYELSVPAGVKTSKIISLETDIALRMKAVSVRIAVVPGKDVIGIEIPNKNRKTVFLKEILQSKAFKNTKANLPIVLGYDINGNSIVEDLSSMPHLLIAGTTGSGKSVGVNGMILSLLYKLSPENCKLIMIDPKMLELSIYQDIPHLLSPVVTNPKQAISALKWVVKEMENRYYKMSLFSVRNITGYNNKLKEVESVKNIKQKLYETQNIEVDFDHMPYIVVIIDEMADLMMVAGKEVEIAVQRLAQMARASGIHLIMSTQRPSVDVITGTIKANFPSRISFQVSSKIDSRTILGEQGGEQLLGKGDMLYMSGVGRINRVHGPFVDDDEVSSIVSYLKDLSKPIYIDNIVNIDTDEGNISNNNEYDDLYDEVITMIKSEGKVSTSFIQRKFQIGYNRAARIVEQLENNGVVGKASPTGKREILINLD